MRAATTALLGVLVLSPAARAADTPAFMGSALCTVAAPLATGIVTFRHRIRAVRPTDERGARQPRPTVPARGGTVPEGAEPPPGGAGDLLRQAMHFCVVPSGTPSLRRHT